MSIYTQRQYSNSLTKWSAYYGHNPDLVYRLINYENRGVWRMDIGDEGQSYGLMQTQIPTVRDAINGGYLPGGVASPEWLMDPDNNIKAGCAVLDMKRDLVGVSKEAFMNDPDAQRRVLSAYNGDTSGRYANNVMAQPINKDEEGNYAPVVGNAPAGSVVIPGTSSPSSVLSSVSDSAIVKFLALIESNGFVKSMTSAFEADGKISLNAFIKRFLATFYHDIYYVPTLPNCMAAIVKPETMFINAPSCNVLYPAIRQSANYSRNEKSEPTRIVMSSNSMTGVLKNYTGSVTNVVHTMVFLDLDDKGKEVLKYVKQLAGDRLQQPMGLITKYEKKFGVRVSTSNMGNDLYMFMLSNGEKSGGHYKIAVGDGSMEAVAGVLGRLAKYALMRDRYSTRPGGCSGMFNPYIVPGFPAISFETANESTLDTKMYVTSVTHHITEGNASTSISYNGCHTENELPPEVFPILEDEYVDKIATTYKEMLGECVSVISDPKKVKKDYAESDPTLTTSMKKIWRPITTMEDFMKDIADGAVISNDKGYVEATGGYFDGEIQKKVRQYTETMRDRVAYHDNDVK